MPNKVDIFCGSKFWDVNLTWNTDEPELTSCFEQTALVWSPTVFLWLLLPLDLYYTFNSKYRDIPWSWNNISKLVINGLLIITCIFDFIYVLVRRSHGYVVNNVDIYTPVIKFICMSLCFTLVLSHKKWGKMSSELLCSYWFFLCLLGIPQFRTDLYSFQDGEDNLPAVKVSYMISYCLWAVMLILNCFADVQPQQSSILPVNNPCPESSSSFPSRLFYTWFDGLALLGFRKPLENSDLWHLNYSEMTNVVSHQFDHYWEKAMAKQVESLSEKSAHMSKDKKVDSEINVDFVKGRSREKQVSIVLPLWKAFGGTFLVGSVIKLIQNLLSFASPLILDLLIGFIGSDEPTWRGYLFAVALFANSALQTLLISQYFQKMFLTGLHIKTSLMSAIYRKALRISNASRKESAIGEIVNLMAVDCQRFMLLTNNLNMIWSIPFQIALSIYLLWRLLGPSVLAGLAVLVAFIPLNAFIASKIKKLQTKQMRSKDERVKTMNEVLSGIKVLKLYAWEPSFEEFVTKIRNKETRVLKHIAYYMSSIAITWVCTPFLVGLVTFTIFVYSDPKNILDAKVAFVSLALINVIRVPLALLPITLMDTTQAWVSIKRINNFLNLEELDPDSVLHDPNEDDPLVMDKCNFSWDNEGGIILKDISLRVKKGSLVAVVGAVGSGKSSLLAACLGEMDKISGKINTKGKIAYVPQLAWIQNATLKDNILFGKSFNERIYKRVVEACALAQDLEMLPGGDLTEIGEKGINLSGGQKQRVSIARAVYHDSDIYLLDDPLSAVDSHVGKHIFHDVIGPAGVLKKKTRLLVTHGVSFLPQADVIVVLKDGTISEMGTYKDLMNKKGSFSDFILTHLQEELSDNDEELDEFKELLGSNQELQELISEHRARHKSITSESGASVRSFKSQRSTDSIRSVLRNRRSSDNIQFGNSIIKSDKMNGSQSATVTAQKLTEEEKMETGTVKWEVYKQYVKSVGMAFCFLSVFLHVLFESLSIGTNIWLTIWSNDSLVVVNGTQDTVRLNKYIIVYTVLGASQGVVSMFTDMAPVLGCWLAGVILHKQLLHTIFRLPLSFFDTTPSGRILARFSKDLDILDCIIPRNVSDCVWGIFLVLGTLVIISYSTPIFMVTILPISLIYYLIQKYYVATSRQLNRLESISRSPIYNHFSESISGAMSIRAYNVLDRFIYESEQRIDRNLTSYYPSLISQRWLAVRLDMMGTLIILFAAIFAVRAKGWITAGLAGLSVSHALQITEIFNMLVKLLTDIQVNIVAAERIKEYTDVKQEAEWEVQGSNVSNEWPERGEVEFKDFRVRYREGLDCVLKGITFSISGGEKVGVVGRTGAGKSSLTLSLFRIIEAASGHIFIDGLEISKLGLHTLRSRLTIIPQDPVLFSGSLRMNLDPFGKYNDDQVWRSLELSHLKDFVKGLNAGLQYEVSEGGENLSVGQRQLICLARALLRKTKVLVLDEATAAIDLETDDLIQKTIRSEFANCTVITIAHRINTILDSDRVIVLDQGLIMEFDKPDILLKNKKSVFYSMAKDAGLA